MTASSRTKAVPPLMTEAERADYDRKRGRIVPWLLAAFFVSFIAPLIGFVFIAAHNAQSEVTTLPYEKGLAYNRTLEAAAAQSGLGWRASADFDAGVLHVELKDAAGAPLEATRVRAWFVHPANKAFDATVDLVRVAPGRFEASPQLAVRAGWTLRVTAATESAQMQSAFFVEG